jgi:SAM domain (Sterile alpha motif)
MDVAAWLQDLGLERYVSAFRDNDMDAEVLLSRTPGCTISARRTTKTARSIPSSPSSSVPPGFESSRGDE